MSCCVDRGYATVNIDIGCENLVFYDAGITGEPRDRGLIDLIENMLSQVGRKGRAIYV